MTTPITPIAALLQPVREIAIYQNRQLIKRQLLTKKSLIIGRRRDCDITLLDGTISSYHALILNDENDSYIEDQESTNGVYINHQKKQRHKLADGDHICIGKFQIKFSHKPLHIK
ncbi:MAG: FHA domain-containing protein [bacterium]